MNSQLINFTDTINSVLPNITIPFKHNIHNKFPSKSFSLNPTIIRCSSSLSNIIISTPHSLEEEDDEEVNKALILEEEKKDETQLVFLQENDSCDEKITSPLNEIWREIQGCDDWEGLLDPMNPHLRKEIIRYGEFAQACYDSFDFDPHSKYCGTCKYTGPHFFEKLDMANRGYDITRYIYATSNINLPNFFQKSRLSKVWSTHANWMGCVAVCTDQEEIKRLGRRDIVIAWRGTVTYLEWIYDLKDVLCSANFTKDRSIKIELGFYDLYTKKEKTCNYCSFSAREQVLAEIKRLVELYRDDDEEISISITGHSLGAALAIISANDIAEMGLNYIDTTRVIPITVFSFSGPRVGNLKFKERCDELGIKVLRVINIHDKVAFENGTIEEEDYSK
ncbi:hypothetical protein ACFE04_007312 [Oxalis oulophora]